MPFPETDQQQIQAWMTSLQDEQKRKNLNQQRNIELYGNEGLQPDQGFGRVRAENYGPEGNIVKNIQQDYNQRQANSQYGQAVSRMQQQIGPQPATQSFSNIPTAFPTNNLDPADLAKRLGIRAQRQANGNWSFSS